MCWPMPGDIAAALAERDLVCDCPSQQPERVLVGALSLLVCVACERFVLTERRPDMLAVLRQDLEGLKLIVARLERQAGEVGRTRGRRPGRVALRVLHGGPPVPPEE